MATWYREIRPRPRLRLHVFNATFTWSPTIGEWTDWHGVCGYTLNWLHWSIGYHIDREMPAWRRALLKRRVVYSWRRRRWLSP